MPLSFFLTSGVNHYHPIKDFLKKAFLVVKKNKNYKKFIMVEILAGAGGIALPFYILYLKNILGISLGTIGILLSAQMLGSVLSNVLWAHLSDFVGNKKVIQISTFAGLMVPVVALMTQFKTEGLKNITSLPIKSEELKINLERESIDAVLLYDVLHYMGTLGRKRIYEEI